MQFFWLDVLTTIKRKKGNKAIKERASSIPHPSLLGFQHGSGGGLKPATTLWVRRGWANFKVETFLLNNFINAKEASSETRSMKTPQSKPRTRKNKKREWSCSSSTGNYVIFTSKTCMDNSKNHLLLILDPPREFWPWLRACLLRWKQCVLYLKVSHCNFGNIDSRSREFISHCWTFWFTTIYSSVHFRGHSLPKEGICQIWSLASRPFAEVAIADISVCYIAVRQDASISAPQKLDCSFSRWCLLEFWLDHRAPTVVRTSWRG